MITGERNNDCSSRCSFKGGDILFDEFENFDIDLTEFREELSLLFFVCLMKKTLNFLDREF